MPEDPNTDKQGVKARKLAVDILTRVEKTGGYANLALGSELDKSELSQRDRAFVTALVQGVLRNKNKLDELIEEGSSQPLAKIQKPTLNLLRMALFQLDEMQDIPESAVVDTACNIARKVGHKGLVAFVNGFLRGYLRKTGKERSANTDESAKPGKPPKSLASRYSMPDWLVERWLSQYGEETEALLKASKTPPPLTLRINQEAVETEAFREILAGKGIKTRAGKLVKHCLLVENRKETRGKVEEIPGFADGLFIVQDEAAAFISQVVAPKPGEQIVDLCAAPGGKTINLAELMQGKGRVIAVDVHAGRLSLVKQNRLRMGFRNIETKKADGRTFKLPGGADRVLLDAPCSGTGVINKRADLTENRQSVDIASLRKLQEALIENAGNIVRPGGYLVYSTCSIEAEEGPQLIDWYLSRHPEFTLVSIEDAFSESTLDEFKLREEAKTGKVMLLPSRHGVSGFFVARLKKSVQRETETDPG